MFRKQYLVREFDFQPGSRRLGQAVLMAALFLLLLALAPSAQAQGSCAVFSSNAFFRLPSSGFIRGTQPFYPTRECAPPSRGSISFGKYGSATDRDRQAAIASCNRHNGSSNMTVGRFGGFWSCRLASNSDSGSSGGGGSGSGSGSRNSRRRIAPQQLPLASVRVSAELGMNSGIQFQRFTHYAVGIQSVADMGILDVVDVWGNANQNYEVCFPLSGEIVFLDAATSPRTVVSISWFVRDAYTCGAMDQAGTMVLVEGSTKSASNAALAQSFIDSTTDPVSSAIDLENCTVTPSHSLNLRAEPWGEKLDIVPKASTLTATARTQSWFKVSYTNAEAEESEGEDTQAAESEGWIAAWLSEVDGDCDWEADDDDSPALASTGFPAQDEHLGIA